MLYVSAGKVRQVVKSAQMRALTYIILSAQNKTLGVEATKMIDIVYYRFSRYLFKRTAKIKFTEADILT